MKPRRSSTESELSLHPGAGTGMTIAGYNDFCASLPHTSHVVQWGGADVWKVAGKVFAIARWNAETAELWVTFKVSPVSYEMLQEMPGLRPAPYLASRGMKWIQRTGRQTMNDAALRDALVDSHRLVAETLPKRLRMALGLVDDLTKSTPANQKKPTRPSRGNGTR